MNINELIKMLQEIQKIEPNSDVFLSSENEGWESVNGVYINIIKNDKKVVIY